VDRSDIEGWLELRVVACLCQIVGIHPDRAWASWVGGAMAKGVVTRLARHFVNPDFVINVDGPQTYKYMQFSCGTAYNTVTHQTERGVPAMMITHTTGWPYPTEDFERLDRELSARGLDLEATFCTIRDAEDTGGGAQPYPADELEALQAIVDAFPVEFELVQMMHSSFTANNADGEAAGGWPVCLWRCFKVAAASMMVVAENFLVDKGIEGNNGKGVLWNMMFNCLGSYAKAVNSRWVADGLGAARTKHHFTQKTLILTHSSSCLHPKRSIFHPRRFTFHPKKSIFHSLFTQCSLTTC